MCKREREREREREGEGEKERVPELPIAHSSWSMMWETGVHVSACCQCINHFQLDICHTVDEDVPKECARHWSAWNFVPCINIWCRMCVYVHVYTGVCTWCVHLRVYTGFSPENFRDPTWLRMDVCVCAYIVGLHTQRQRTPPNWEHNQQFLVVLIKWGTSDMK